MIKDLSNQQFCRLTAVKNVGVNKHRAALWLCKCICGNEIIIPGASLTTGNTKSCGCLQKEMASKYCKENYKKYNTYNLDSEYGIGYTLKNEEFYFDLEDYEKIKDYCWFTNDQDYIITNSSSGAIRLHRLVLNAEPHQSVDHINRMRSDNRKQNLRIADKSQNAMNQNLRQDNSSGYTGVSWIKTGSKWNSYITINQKIIGLGHFENKIDAIIARLSAEKKYFGEFAPQRHLFEKYNIN